MLHTWRFKHFYNYIGISTTYHRLIYVYIERTARIAGAIGACRRTRDHALGPNASAFSILANVPHVARRLAPGWHSAHVTECHQRSNHFQPLPQLVYYLLSTVPHSPQQAHPRSGIRERARGSAPLAKGRGSHITPTRPPPAVSGGNPVSRYVRRRGQSEAA